MKWGQIDYFKQHSRIDYNCEDALLEQYGEAAEEFILAYTGRTYENFIDLYGSIPARVYECTQLLVDNMYQNRSMVTMTNMSVVPYTFDAMISDFVRYTEETPLQCERDTLLKKLTALSSDFNFAVADMTSTSEIEAIKTSINNLLTKYAAVENPTTKICAKLREALTGLTETCAPYINGEVNGSE